jgi:tetratricopeptide (TPR) repeat protein
MQMTTATLTTAGILLSVLGLFAQTDRSFVEAQIRKWQQVVAHDPKDYETLVAIGAAYGKLGEHATAVTYFNKAISVNPSYAQAYAALGTSYGFLRRPADAAAALKKAVSLDPNDPFVRTKLSTTLGKARQYSEAITQLKEAVKLRPELADAHFALGLAYVSIGDRQKAVDEVNTLARIDAQQAAQLRSLVERSLP